MARISYLLRRGASYYARIKVPTDLVEIFGRKELVKALGTKDENVAKREMWPVVEAWNRKFDDLRARREITPHDKADAGWQHYEATLERDEVARRSAPTQADIEAATATAIAQAQRDQVDMGNPLTVLNASLDAMALKGRQDFEAHNRWSAPHFDRTIGIADKA